MDKMREEVAGAGILLESGTNELEIVEFQINRKDEKGDIQPGYYGVNVAKVREIIKSPETLAEVPRTHPAISGIINLRGKIIPIIDLPQWLKKGTPDMKRTRVIITEFNRVLTGFLVHSVARIHRVSWEQVESPSGLMNQAEKECVTGLIKFENKILMMLDFERIVVEINPEIGLNRIQQKVDKRRSGKTVLVAEDSAFIRKMMCDMLRDAGYRVFTAKNGLEAMEKLENVASESAARGIPIEKYLNLVISDVEMPKMDGLHLVTKLKEHKTLKSIPVVMFSSLVTKENKRKWAAIGAKAFISKPEINQLINTVDSLVL